MEIFTLKIEDWWTKVFHKCDLDKNQAIKKFKSATEDYHVTNEDVEDKVTVTESEKKLFWKNGDKNFYTMVFDVQSETLKFKQTVKSEKENEREEKTVEIFKDNQEQNGEETIIVNGAKKQITKWRIMNEENKVVELWGEKETKSGKGTIKFYEKLEILENFHQFTVEKQRGSKDVKKTKTLHANTLEIEIVKTNLDLYKKTTRKIVDYKKNGACGEDSGQIERKRRDEVTIKTWICNKPFETKEISIISKEKTIGRKTYSDHDNNYEIDWIMTDQYFLGKIKIYSTHKHCFSQFKTYEKDSIELTNFSMGSKKWGLIEKYSQNEGFNMEWTGQEPPEYEKISEKMIIQDSKEPKTFIMKEKSLEEYKKHAEDLFEFTGKMAESQCPGLRLKKKSEKNEELRTAQADILLKKLKQNSNRVWQLINTQTEQQFRGKLKKCKKSQRNAFKHLLSHQHLNSLEDLTKLSDGLRTVS